MTTATRRRDLLFWFLASLATSIVVHVQELHRSHHTLLAIFIAMIVIRILTHGYYAAQGIILGADIRYRAARDRRMSESMEALDLHYRASETYHGGRMPKLGCQCPGCEFIREVSTIAPLEHVSRSVTAPTRRVTDSSRCLRCSRVLGRR